MDQKQVTPWQRIFEKFGMSQAEFARAIGRHRSKICIALRDEKGLINGRDQELILNAAGKLNVAIEPADLLPGA